MPSVSSTFPIQAPIQQSQKQLPLAIVPTPTTHHPKLQQQHSLPLQLHYQNQQPATMVHQQVTTTQPSPAGTFISQTAGLINSTVNTGIMINSNVDDTSPISSTASFSSADTNQTILNSIVNQQQQQQQITSLTPNSIQRTNSNASTTNRSYRTKYGQFMIITPAVSIDRDFENETTNIGNQRQARSKTYTNSAPTTLAAATNLLETPSANLTTPINATTNNTSAHNMDNDIDDMSSYFNNGNIFRMTLLQSSIDSGCSSDSSSFRSNYNPYLHTSHQHLLPKSTPQNFYTFSSWRWCTLICAAMRCFGAGHSSHASYSSSFGRPPYQRSRSNGSVRRPTSIKSNTPHQRLRQSSSFTAETAFEHFSAPFTPRKTRDHLNNITYEL